MTPQELRKTVLHIDGLRYSFSMADLAGRRLRATLDEVARCHVAGQNAEEAIISAVLDSWSIIDMCHRARELVQQVPGLSQRLPTIQVFLRGTQHIEQLRHYVQHFRTGILSVPAYSTPLWGGISWIPTGEKTTCFTIHTGNLLEGLETPSVSYDTHKLRFTADIVLYAGGASADLLSVVELMLRLKSCLLEWIEQNPDFTRADAKTLVWTITMTPQFANKPEDGVILGSNRNE